MFDKEEARDLDTISQKKLQEKISDCWETDEGDQMRVEDGKVRHHDSLSVKFDQSPSRSNAYSPAVLEDVRNFWLTHLCTEKIVVKFSQLRVREMIPAEL